MGGPVVSIVIPTLNEASLIDGTLESLRGTGGARTPRPSRSPVEIIVSDGGSTDGTRERVSRHDGVRLVVGAPGRARQLTRGVEEASGALLLFLHADMRLPAGALACLEALAGRATAGKWLYGGFPHRYWAGGPVIRLASAVHSVRSRLTGTYYGDQAPFLSRALYDRLGGFRDLPAMEDVDIARRARRLVAPVRMPEPVRNSPRKLEQRGVLRCAVDAIVLLAWLRLGRHAAIARHPYFAPIR
jgi:glycosyltransferase involved in cell wall biosynthesis